MSPGTTFRHVRLRPTVCRPRKPNPASGEKINVGAFAMGLQLGWARASGDLPGVHRLNEIFRKVSRRMQGGTRLKSNLVEGLLLKLTIHFIRIYHICSCWQKLTLFSKRQGRTHRGPTPISRDGRGPSVGTAPAAGEPRRSSLPEAGGGKGGVDGDPPLMLFVKSKSWRLPFQRINNYLKVSSNLSSVTRGLGMGALLTNSTRVKTWHSQVRWLPHVFPAGVPAKANNPGAVNEPMLPADRASAPIESPSSGRNGPWKSAPEWILLRARRSLLTDRTLTSH